MRDMIYQPAVTRNPPSTFGWGNTAYGRSTSRQPPAGRHKLNLAIPGVLIPNVRSPNHQKIPPIECCRTNWIMAITEE